MAGHSDKPDAVRGTDTRQSMVGDVSGLTIDEVCRRALQEQWDCADRDVLLSAEEVFERYPSLRQHSEHQVDVVYNEFLISRESGPGAGSDPRSYLQRFPQLESQLFRQFQLHDCLSSGFDNDDTDTQSNNTVSEMPVPDLTGVMLRDRYELLQKIGSGGIADVYRAHDSQLKRDVALKISRTPFAADSHPFRRFLREAESVGRLSHPGIVQVYEFGDLHQRPFIVGQLVAGGTLKDSSAVAPQSSEQIRQLCEWMIQICDAADYAHQCGIVHRDLKPANILFDTTSRPLIADFGLAALVERESTLTEQGDILGTPPYMSPEQVTSSGDVGPLTDIYSLGVIFYQLLTGRLPFTGTTTAVLHQILNSDPIKPHRINPAVSPDAETICLKAMSRLPSDRYASAREFAEDLRRFQNDEPILARRLNPADRLTRLIRRHPTTSLLVFLQVIAAAVLLGGTVQYRNVVTERDRANIAEAKTRDLLAQDAIVSGRLARQQGFTDIAVQRFREAIERGHPDTAAILTEIAACEVVNGRFEHAEQCLADAIRSDSAFSGKAEVRLLKAYLALLNGEPFAQTDELLRTIDADQLTEPDLAFLQGLLAENSPTALRHFQRAIELDSHHHASRRMAGILALSLANFELAESLSTVSRQLFPDDVDFVFMNALTFAGTGRLDGAKELLSSQPIRDNDREACLLLAEFLNTLRTGHNTGGERVFHKHLSASSSELSFEKLVSLLSEFQDKFVPFLRRRRWLLPPNTEVSIDHFLETARADRSEGLLSVLAATVTGDESAAQEFAMAGLQVMEVHPEGTLSTVIARQLLDEGTLDLQQLLRIQQFYENAMTAHAFAADVRTHAILGAFAVAAHLMLIEQHEPDRNLQRVFELMELMSPDSITEANTARVLTLLCTKHERWQDAALFASRWVELARLQPSKHKLVEALWNSAVIREHEENWPEVMTLCNEIIDLSPNPNAREAVIAPEGLRNRATAELTAALADGKSLHWDRIFTAALNHDDLPLAEFALKQIKKQSPTAQSLPEFEERLQALRSQEEN
ncbi:MAG: protein kinase [Planctomycetaceae bacterium]